MEQLQARFVFSAKEIPPPERILLYVDDLRTPEKEKNYD